MPARKTPPERPRKASGANIEEWQRHTPKVQFRLRSEEHAWLEHLARQAGESANVHALRLVRTALGYRHPPRPELTEAEEREAARADRLYDEQRDSDR